MKMRFKNTKRNYDKKNHAIVHKENGILKLRPNMYGIPTLKSWSILSGNNDQTIGCIALSSMENAYPLGNAQISFWSFKENLPRLTYQIFDPRRQTTLGQNRYYYKCLDLPKKLQFKSKEKFAHYDFGHCNSYQLCSNKYDARCSNSQLNLFPQNLTNNRITWKKLEDKIVKTTKKLNAIAYITTAVLYKPYKEIKFCADKYCKVVFYKKLTGLISKCYLLDDDSINKSKYREVNLIDIERIFNLKFMNIHFPR